MNHTVWVMEHEDKVILNAIIHKLFNAQSLKLDERRDLAKQLDAIRDRMVSTILDM